MLKIDKNSRIENDLRHISEVQISEITNKWIDKPEPGMMGTEFVGSDRYAVVCVNIYSPKRIGIVRLYDIDEDNIYSHSNIYIDDRGIMFWKTDKEYTDIIPYSLRKNNTWHAAGESIYSSPVYFGIANPYRDPNF